MITDEKIKEEFDKWYNIPMNQNEIDMFTKNKADWKEVSFTAGFRSAERLAKIEVLEKLIDEFGFDIGGVAYHNIQTQIASLKAEP